MRPPGDLAPNRQRGPGSGRWTALVTDVLFFVVWMVEAEHWYLIDGRLLLDGDGGPIGTNLKDAIFWWTFAL